MIIGSVSENKNIEKRVAITPDIIKKYKLLGLEVNLSKNYASHLGIGDKEFEDHGAKILSSDEVIAKSNVILQMNILDDENLKKLQKNQILFGVLNPFINRAKLKELTSKIPASLAYFNTSGNVIIFPDESSLDLYIVLSPLQLNEIQ